jgi:hypothetical protein
MFFSFQRTLQQMQESKQQQSGLAHANQKGLLMQIKEKDEQLNSSEEARHVLDEEVHRPPV